MTGSPLAILGYALIAASACSPAGTSAAPTVTRDSSGVLITEIPDDALRSASEWSADPTPRIVLGASRSDDGSRFFRITGARLLSGDRVAVTSDAAKQIVVFDADGSVLRTLGRTGRGPGEFLHIRAVPASEPTILVAYDEIQMRLSTFGESATPAIVDLAAVPGGRVRPAFTFDDGSMLVRRPGPLPAPSAEGVVRGRERILRMGADWSILADFGDHPASDRVLRKSTGGLTGGEPPFGRELLVAANDSLVILSSSGAWVIDVLDSHGTFLRSIRPSRERRSVTANMRRDYRARVLSGATDDYGIREWTMLSTDDVFPDEIPAFDALMLDRVGTIWTRETPMLGESDAQWFIFSTLGEPLAHLRLPAAFSPTDIAQDRIAGVWTDSLGGEQVHVYDIERM